MRELSISYGYNGVFNNDINSIAEFKERMQENYCWDSICTKNPAVVLYAQKYRAEGNLDKLVIVNSGTYYYVGADGKFENGVPWFMKEVYDLLKEPVKKYLRK